MFSWKPFLNLGLWTVNMQFWQPNRKHFQNVGYWIKFIFLPKRQLFWKGFSGHVNAISTACWKFFSKVHIMKYIFSHHLFSSVRVKSSFDNFRLKLLSKFGKFSSKSEKVPLTVQQKKTNLKFFQKKLCLKRLLSTRISKFWEPL